MTTTKFMTTARSKELAQAAKKVNYLVTTGEEIKDPALKAKYGVDLRKVRENILGAKIRESRRVWQAKLTKSRTAKRIDRPHKLIMQELGYTKIQALLSRVLPATS